MSGRIEWGYLPPPPRRPRISRVTVIVEADDQVIAWQIRNPDDADVRVDADVAAPRWTSLSYAPRELSATYRIGVDVKVSEEGYLLAHTPAAVSALLRDAGLVLKRAKGGR